MRILSLTKRCLPLCLVFPFLAVHVCAKQKDTHDTTPSRSVTIKPVLADDPEARDAITRGRLVAWTSVLSQVANNEGADLFFDINPNLLPPTIPTNVVRGKSLMDVLAQATARKWLCIDGVQTFVRNGDITAERSDQINQALDVLTGLSPTDRKDLVDGHFAASRLSPDNRRAIFHLAEWDPDMGFVLLQQKDQVGLRLALALRVSYTEHSTGILKTETISRNTPMDEIPRTETAVKETAFDFEPLEVPDVGPLDFKTGQLLTLREIVAKAEATFGQRYKLDERVSTNKYFINGKWSQKMIEDVLAKAATVPPISRLAPSVHASVVNSLLHDPVLKDQKVDVAELRRDIPIKSTLDLDDLVSRYGAHEYVDAADFIDGKTVLVSELSKDKPGLNYFLTTTLGLSPDDTVTLSARATMQVQADGEHISSMSGAWVNGQFIQSTTPNFVSVVLW